MKRYFSDARRAKHECSQSDAKRSAWLCVYKWTRRDWVIWCFNFANDTLSISRVWNANLTKIKQSILRRVTNSKFTRQNGIWQLHEAGRCLSTFHFGTASIFSVSYHPLICWGPWMWSPIPGKAKVKGLQDPPNQARTHQTGQEIQPDQARVQDRLSSPVD